MENQIIYNSFEQHMVCYENDDEITCMLYPIKQAIMDNTQNTKGCERLKHLSIPTLYAYKPYENYAIKESMDAIEDSKDFVDLDKMYNSDSDSDHERDHDGDHDDKTKEIDIASNDVISNNVFSNLSDSIALHKERLSRKKKAKKNAVSKKVRFKKNL
jgi:hypothetical protein